MTRPSNAVMPDNAQGSTNFTFAFSTVPVEEEKEEEKEEKKKEEVGEEEGKEEDDDDSRSGAGSSQDAYSDNVTSGQAYCLYVSHSLSMWNSRMYEFAVVRIKIHRSSRQR